MLIACVPPAVRDLEDSRVVIRSLHLLGSQTTLDIPMSAPIIAPEYEVGENDQNIIKLARPCSRATSIMFNYTSNFSRLRKRNSIAT